MNHSLINGCRNTFLKVRFLTIKLFLKIHPPARKSFDNKELL